MYVPGVSYVQVVVHEPCPCTFDVQPGAVALLPLPQLTISTPGESEAPVYCTAMFTRSSTCASVSEFNLQVSGLEFWLVCGLLVLVGWFCGVVVVVGVPVPLAVKLKLVQATLCMDALGVNVPAEE